jgi:ArsR family transcriptional regulator
MLNINEDLSTIQLQYDLSSQLLKVLSHPVRLAILDVLRDGEHCVCHMEAYLGQRQAYISQQLSVLREARLILDRRDGWNVFYRVADKEIFSLLDLVWRYTGQVRSSLEPSVICPCPHCQKNLVKSESGEIK